MKSQDTLFTMLPDGDAVKEVYLNPSNGVLAGIQAAASGNVLHKLIVECGTIESAKILEVGKAANLVQSELPTGSEVDFVDAPVSGGPNGAVNGTLAFMVGTDRPDPVFEQVKRYLVHMGKPDGIFLCGGLGAGVAFKIINNYVSTLQCR